MLEHWQEGFLSALRKTGNVRLSAQRAGVQFSTAYYHRRSNREFKMAWDGALNFYKQQRTNQAVRCLI